jgi:hypothetical protein
MKITYHHLRIAVIAMACGLILLGILHAIFKFQMDAQIENMLTTTLTFGALGIYLWSIRLRKETEAAERAKKLEAEKGPETEAEQGNDSEAKDQ